jgi:hypothetical protein
MKRGNLQIANESKGKWRRHSEEWPTGTDRSDCKSGS